MVHKTPVLATNDTIEQLFFIFFDLVVTCTFQLLVEKRNEKTFSNVFELHQLNGLNVKLKYLIW